MKKNEIDKTLASLDNLTRATAPKGFSDQLLQKIQEAERIIVPWYFQLKYAAAAMVALLIINGFILFQSDLVTSQEELTVESLADEWYAESDVIEFDYEIQ